MLIPAIAHTAPASRAQEGLWFMQQLEPSSAVFTIRVAFRLSGELDERALVRSVETLIERHESLRTRFALADGRVVRVLSPQPAVQIRIVPDAGPALDGQVAAADEVARAASAVFELEHGSVGCVTIVRVGPHEHVLVIALHHALCDATSFDVLCGELGVLYAAFLRGHAPGLPPAPGYDDFVTWERARESEADFDDRLQGWIRELRSSVPGPLPADRQGPRLSFRGGSHLFGLDRAEVDALTTFARAHRVTPAMVLTLALYVVLYRCSGHPEWTIGMPVSLRSRPEWDGVVGPFTNVLPLRLRLASHDRADTVLPRLRDAMLGLVERRDVPLSTIVSGLPPYERRAPFDVVCSCHGAGASLELEGLSVERLWWPRTASEYSLALDVKLSPQSGMQAQLDYSSELFDASSVAQLARVYQRTVKELIAAPATAVGSMALTTDGERQQLLRDARGPHHPPPVGECVHARISEQARRLPGEMAVLSARECITYGDLEQRSDALAQALRALGVSYEVPVGVCLERSVDLVVALLGILKAGGVYVPLDRSVPDERLAFIAVDARLHLIVTATFDVARLRAVAPLHVTVASLDDIARERALAAREPRATTDPAGLAYVIYTSGSTGVPKGVMVPHAGLPNLVDAQRAAFDVVPGSRVLCCASIGFDASIAEILVTLSAGATACMADEDTLLSPQRFAEAVAAQQITHVTLPPSILAALAPNRVTPTLRTVIAAGEALPSSIVESWSARVERMLNAYGPTEATVCATISEPLRLEPEGIRPSVGRPMQGMVVYVRDAEGELMPAGLPGELYIGGVGVSRGYVNRPGLTAERFVPDPDAHEPGSRCYRTGDRVRWRADGQLEFLGRADDQIKLRGYRIELGEIEHQLHRIPGVARGAVVVLDETGGERRLVAYVVPQPGSVGPDVKTLRRELGRRLPAYMIPASCVLVEALPLTVSGKVDRSRLRALAVAAAPASHPYVAPRTATEQRVAAIWAQVLGVERVGLHDDFFTLGGHSMLAAQINARVSEAFQIELSIRAVLDTPAVADYVRHVDALRARPPDAPGQSRVGLRPSDVARRRARTAVPQSS